MRNMARYVMPVFAFLLVFSLVACKRTREEYSPVMHESGTVLQAVYTPSTHRTELGVTAFETGPLGMDYSGNPGISLGNGMQISQVTVPEKFAIVFRCEHGEFIITRKDVYEQLKNFQGRAVDIEYREVYRVVYEEQDGKEQVLDRKLVDYDFIRAVPKSDR
ncbi:MAG: hypothetical protein HYS44_03570 [Candidatus Niyogibacteria bacterium]|nr:hypothetical protein [Candidatus Niyogibacteria bacterium]